MAAMHDRPYQLPGGWTLAGLATGLLLLDVAACRRPTAEINSPEREQEPARTAEQECKPSEPNKPAAKPGSSDDHDPPQIIAASFIARDRLLLRFSEAVEPPTQVNPRQFRISHGYSMVDYGGGYGQAGGYAHAYYYDLLNNGGYDAPLVFVTLEAAGAPEELELQLSQAIPVEICEDINLTKQDLAQEAAAGGPPTKGQVGVFLHYTSRGSVGIRDLAGNPLADIGAEWALHFGVRTKQLNGAPPVVRFDLLVELLCPTSGSGALDGPPGPH
jgi:hypothetical protein